MALSKYNKDRPFLIVSHSALPGQGQKTSLKDWGEDARWDINENIVIVDRVNDKHLVGSSVIVDIFKQTLVKNRFAESHTKEEVVKHYLKKYNKEVIEGIDIWMRGRSDNKSEARKLINDLEDELSKIDVEIENEG